MLETCISDIKSFIQQRGGSYEDFYVGISKNAARRLFGDHCVELNEPTWIFINAENAATARAVEIHFLVLGCEGGSGGGDDESKFVYAYQMTRLTKP
jgi:hypothetical protein